MALVLTKLRGPCGFASVVDVAGEAFRLEDKAESYFLSETVMYPYLLLKGARGMADAFVMSTEGHPLPVQPAQVTPTHARRAAKESHVTWERNLCSQLPLTFSAHLSPHVPHGVAGPGRFAFHGEPQRSTLRTCCLGQLPRYAALG